MSRRRKKACPVLFQVARRTKLGLGVVLVENRYHGEEGQHCVHVPERILSDMRTRPLLRGVLVTGAGSWAKTGGHFPKNQNRASDAVFVYCTAGSGFCEIQGKSYTVRKGDLLFLSAGVPHTWKHARAESWTLHWVAAIGDNIPEYLLGMGISGANPLVQVGEDLQVPLLFNEIYKALERGPTYLHLLLASHALSHLLAVLHERVHEPKDTPPSSIQKIAQAIVYMSDHLDQPMRVTALAALANISPAHFTVLFKEESGCSPRDYLNLLRIHRACQLLRSTTLGVKNIAAKLGYQDQFHFSRQFKAFQGVSPTQYRDSVR